MYMNLTYNIVKRMPMVYIYFPFGSMYEIRLYYLNIIKKKIIIPLPHIEYYWNNFLTNYVAIDSSSM